MDPVHVLLESAQRGRRQDLHARPLKPKLYAQSWVIVDRMVDYTGVIDRIRVGIGLAGLASVAAPIVACGPGSPTRVENTQQTTSETGETLVCLVENYAEHADNRGFLGYGCEPLDADGQCVPCDAECMEAILPTCPDPECSGGALPDLPCPDECFNHLVLCSEVVVDECCHVVTSEGGFGGGVPGRPLRVQGEAVVPRLQAHATGGGLQQHQRAAGAYRNMARGEHSSAHAFAWFAQELEKLGAPASLLAGYRDAEEDESLHTSLALAAAQSIDGVQFEVGGMPELHPSFDLRVFTEELVVDGCMGESFAAVEAALLCTQMDAAATTSRSGPAAILDYWRAVARDETRHAILAWKTLLWLFEAHPETIAWARAAFHDHQDPPLEAARPVAPELGLLDVGARRRLWSEVARKLIDEARESCFAGH
jgi:hypothetical protein